MIFPNSAICHGITTAYALASTAPMPLDALVMKTRSIAGAGAYFFAAFCSGLFSAAVLLARTCLSNSSAIFSMFS